MKKQHPWSRNSTPPSDVDITHLLQRWQVEGESAFEELIEAVYDELYIRARGLMRREKPGHTLSCTALIHEAYLKLIDERHRDWQNRSHFYAICSQIMKQVLLHHLEKKKAQKRGGGKVYGVEDFDLFEDANQAGFLTAVDQALEKLRLVDKRKAHIIEMKCFLGMKNHEISEVMDVSLATVKRDILFSQTWILTFMKGQVHD